MEGTHLISNFKGVEWSKLDDEKFLIDTLYESCKNGNLTVLTHQSWKFNPQGVTVLLLLAESHCSIHTAPELGVCHIDLYHCGNNGNVYVALQTIREKLNPTNYDTTIIKR